MYGIVSVFCKGQKMFRKIAMTKANKLGPDYSYDPLNGTYYFLGKQLKGYALCEDCVVLARRVGFWMF